MAEWQTRRIQNPLSERACGFNSHPGHHLSAGATLLIERRLRTVNKRLAKLQKELLVANEQLQHFVEEADDTRLRSLVSETPLADHDHREAQKAEAAMKRNQADLLSQLSRLDAEQDDLLDRLNRRRKR